MINKDLSFEMEDGDVETVEVEICLNHDETEYIIIRTQDYQCTPRGIRPRHSRIKVSYKRPDGQTIPIRAAVVDKTINKILPEGLSGYFSLT